MVRAKQGRPLILNHPRIIEAINPKGGQISRILLSLTGVLWISCFSNPVDRHFEKAVEAEKGHQYELAVELLDRVIGIEGSPGSKRGIEAAELAARIALLDLKNFQKAIKYFQHIVIHSPDPAKRIEAQKSLASVYYENIADYESAILQYNKLLGVETDPEEKKKFRFAIAKSYYYLHKFFQAQTELDVLLSEKSDSKTYFDALRLKADLLVSTKKFDQAVEIYQKIIQMFPERSKEEHVELNLAVCYEELEMFDQTIKVLNQIRDEYPSPEFIDIKIKRLKEHQALLPGARGLKK